MRTYEVPSRVSSASPSKSRTAIEVAAITGDYLDDARQNFDQRKQSWVVEFTFKTEGGRLFGELSEANVGEQLAIVLEEVLLIGELHECERFFLVSQLSVQGG